MRYLSGKTWLLGNDIDTDVIIPGSYLASNDARELGRHCLEGIESEWSAKVADGDWIVAGSNFGCGSSREHAVISIKGCGISGVIAESFGSIFFRNAINLGLPVIELENASNYFSEGDIVEVDLEEGEVENKTNNEKYSFKPMPQIVLNILQSGGLLEYIQQYQNKK